MSDSPRRILGLDPGLQVTGYGVVDITSAGPRVAEAGVIRSVEGKEPVELAERLKALYDGVFEVMEQWQPAAACVEQLYAHYDHPRTAILMAHARGCFFLAGAQKGVPMFSYAATQVKKLVTGHGRANKEQMQHCIMRELNLDKLPEPNDVSDALGIALCHYFAGSHIVQGTRSATFTGVNMAALLADTEDED